MHLDQATAAVKAGVKPERLQEWEAGQGHPSLAQARRLAAAYKRPLAALFLPEPPRDFTVPHDFRRVPDLPTPRLSPRLIEEVRLAEYRRSLALDLSDEADGVSDLVGIGSTQEDAEALAHRIRDKLGLTVAAQLRWRDDYEALNAWKSAIEGHGILVFHFSRIAVQEARGFSLADDRFPVIAVNGSDRPRPRIFSLIHELGHIALRRGGISDLHEQDEGSPDTRIEVFCNRFAGALLVPATSLLGQGVVHGTGRHTDWSDRDLADLADLYKVSREVILRRLLSLGRTTESFYRRWQGEQARARPEADPSGFLPVPRRAIRTVGQPFARIVLGAFHEDAITLGDVSEYLGVRVKHLPAIESLLAGPNALTGGDR